MEIYLDNNASTPADPRVIEAYAAAAALAGNPQSQAHALGRAAADRITAGAQGVAQLVDCDPEEVCFVPGATAGLQVALEAERERHNNAFRVLVGATDHPAILEHLGRLGGLGQADVSFVPVDSVGRLQPEVFASKLRLARPHLVCLTAANNEVGTVERLEKMTDLARAAGAVVLIDGSQAVGKLPISFSGLGCDHLVLSGAKLYGLPRTAAVVSQRALHDSVKARFGSPDSPAAVALGVACRLRSEEMTSDEARIATLRNRLQAELKKALPDMVVNGDENGRIAGTLSFAVPDCPNDAVLDRLYGRLSLSTGAACRSGAIAPSHVLVAMGVANWVLDSVLRASVGKFNTLAEIDLAAELITGAITAVRNARQRRIA